MLSNLSSFVVLPGVMIVVWLGLWVIFGRVPLMFFGVALGCVLLLMVIGAVDWALEHDPRAPEGSAQASLFGPKIFVVTFGNSICGVLCCLVLGLATLQINGIRALLRK